MGVSIPRKGSALRDSMMMQEYRYIDPKILEFPLLLLLFRIDYIVCLKCVYLP